MNHILITILSLLGLIFITYIIYKNLISQKVSSAKKTTNPEIKAYSLEIEIQETESKIKEVKRETYENIFFDQLENIKKKSFSWLHYYGIGGVGKTTIKNNLLSKIKTKPYVYSISVDLQQGKSSITVEDFYNEIEKIIRKKIKLYYFTLAYSIYFKTKYPKATMKNNNISFAEEGSLIAELIDEINVNRGIAILQVISKHGLKNIFKNQHYINEIEELREKDKSSIEDELGKFLFYDIEESIQNTPKQNLGFVFFFDTFEALKPEEKLYTVFKKLIQYAKNKNTLFVTSGREQISQTEKNKHFLTQISIEGFSETDAKEILKINGILQNEIIDAIIKNSSGNALYLIASIKLYKQFEKNSIPITLESFSDIDSQILEKLLAYASKSEKENYKALAVVHKFDYELFNFIKKEFNIQETFMDIINNTFTEQKSESFYALHSLIQNAILKAMTKVEKEYNHQKFYKYFKSLLEDEDNLPNYDYLHLLRNCFYHGLQMNNEKGFFQWFTAYEEKLKSHNLQREILSIIENNVLPFTVDEKHSLNIKFTLLQLYIDLNQINDAVQLSNEIVKNYYLTNIQLLDYKYLKGSLLAKTNNNFNLEAFKCLEYVFEYSSNDLQKLDVLWKLLKLFKNKKMKDIYFFEILNLMKNAKDKPHYIQHYRKVGMYYNTMKDYNRSEEYLKKSLTLAKNSLVPTHLDYADIYYTYTKLYLNKDIAYKEIGFENLCKALSIYEKLYTSKHPDILKCYKLLANNYYTDEYIIKLKKLNINHFKILYAILMQKIQSNESYENMQPYLKDADKLFQTNNYKLFKDLAIFSFNNKKFAVMKELASTFESRFLAEIETLNIYDKILRYRELSAFYNSINNVSNSFKYIEIRASLLEDLDDELDDEWLKLYTDLFHYYKKSDNSIKQEEYLHKIINLHSQNSDTKNLDNVYIKLINLCTKNKQYKESEKYHLLKLDLYNFAEIDHFITLDSSYSRIINFYEEIIHNYNKADQFYKKQIHLRKQYKYIDKIAKAYGFYGKFLEWKMDDKKKANSYFLKEIELLREDYSNNLDKLVIAYKALGDFFLRYKMNNEVLNAYKEAYNHAYVTNDYESIFSIIQNMIHKKDNHQDLSIEIKELIDKIEYKIIEKNEFLVYAYNLFPLLMYYCEVFNENESIKQYENNLKNFYLEGNLSNTFYNKAFKDIVIAQRVHQNSTSKYIQGTKDLVIINAIINNAVNVLKLMKEEKLLLNIIEQSVLFYKTISEYKKILDLLDLWANTIGSSKLDQLEKAKQYSTIANLYWELDPLKYFHYYELFLELKALNSTKEYLEIKYHSLKAKATEVNQVSLIKKYDSLLKTLQS